MRYLLPSKQCGVNLGGDKKSRFLKQKMAPSETKKIGGPGCDSDAKHDFGDDERDAYITNHSIMHGNDLVKTRFILPVFLGSYLYTHTMTTGFFLPKHFVVINDESEICFHRFIYMLQKKRKKAVPEVGQQAYITFHFIGMTTRK